MSLSGRRAILDDIVIVARIGAEHCDAPAVFETIAIAGLDDIAIIPMRSRQQFVARNANWPPSRNAAAVWGRADIASEPLI